MNVKIQKGCNGISKIFSIWFLPEGEPLGIVYFAHGVTEYAERHAALLQHLSDAGYLVIANDHMGHGRSSSKARTYFTGRGDKTGWECAAEDAFRLIQIAKEQYPEAPVHGIGFSLGSYLIRFMAMKYHYLFHTVTLIGTGYQKKTKTFIGKVVAKQQCGKYGETERTELIDDLAFGTYNGYFEDDEDEDDDYDYDEYDEAWRALWLCEDPEARREYVEDARCTEGFTAGLFFEMLCAIEYTCDEKRIARLRTKCPILLLSGSDDAAGDFCRAVNELEKIYRKNNLRVRKIFYKEARHDILHDFCKEKVFKDITNFLNKNN